MMVVISVLWLSCSAHTLSLVFPAPLGGCRSTVGWRRIFFGTILRGWACTILIPAVPLPNQWHCMYNSNACTGRRKSIPNLQKSVFINIHSFYHANNTTCREGCLWFKMSLWLKDIQIVKGFQSPSEPPYRKTKVKKTKEPPSREFQSWDTPPGNWVKSHRHVARLLASDFAVKETETKRHESTCRSPCSEGAGEPKFVLPSSPHSF